MISMDKAREALHVASSVGLCGSEWMCGLGVDKVASASNGCGPEWMSQKMRDKLTDFLDIFFPAFCIHDCRFQFNNDGTRGSFYAANDELRLNCLILADHSYSWYDPRRYIWRHRTKIVYLACRDFGWSAWRDAYVESRKSNKEKKDN